MLTQFVLFDGFDPLDVIGPYEVLHAGGTTVELACAEGPRDVVSGLGLSLRAVARLDPDRADVIVVPGAAGRLPAGDDDVAPDSIPGILLATLSTGLPAVLKHALDLPDVTVATVCGGSLILAMAGLIGDRHATTNHLGLHLLPGLGVHAVDARVVDDGDLVTAAGVTSGVDLGLYLLERRFGPARAIEVERLFAHERRGTVWRP
ncbi:DJ-1/PfpI family protein [Nonomuraea soli]|uniref:Putative intracellular protease/amidase n=1 Tax=Nonomuraea soli TaxID=1032476 RepID=A0A7W0CMK3_9ACTN|nr:DJ-1/PfpI family protein [Nonomuraea soli]MBA2893762.1 putative intracellular protease/amidase [Nonomuraea soli]